MCRQVHRMFFKFSSHNFEHNSYNVCDFGCVGTCFPLSRSLTYQRSVVFIPGFGGCCSPTQRASSQRDSRPPSLRSTGLVCAFLTDDTTLTTVDG